MIDLLEDKLYRVEAYGLKESKGGALLVDVEGQEVWIPPALIDEKSEVWKEGDEGELVIPIFLAEEKELV